MSRWAEVLVLNIPELVGGGLIIVLGLLVGNIAASRMQSAPVIEDSEYGD